MPELPEVEIFRRYAHSVALHHPIVHVEVKAPVLLSGLPPDQFGRRICGQAFTETARHGKHLFLKLSGGSWLMIHFGMTGGLTYVRSRGECPRFTGVRFSFSNGHALVYVSARKLGQLCLTAQPASFVTARHLGPDALDPCLTPQDLGRVLRSRKRAVKLVLMDQHLIAGIGNLYADEILFQARLHPFQPAHQLNCRQVTRLFRALRHVCTLAIARDANPSRYPRTWLWHARFAGGRCPRCKASVVHAAKLGSRTTYWCPQCQRGISSSQEQT
ncbi:MAG: Fpg/Nei family DNA glycosylase [Nitrospirae bacterium]|nr:MAG: Fpg/Nei family DNA glycosylase [Nitrospirota bacterium]